MKLLCIYCSSKRVIKKGIRTNRHARVQLYLCKECGRKFSCNGLKSGTYAPSYIARCMRLYAYGQSVSYIAQHFDIPESTVYSWISRYRNIFSCADFHRIMMDYRKRNIRIINDMKYSHGFMFRFLIHCIKTKELVKPFSHSLFLYLNHVLKGTIDNSIYCDDNLRASNLVSDRDFSMFRSKNHYLCDSVKFLLTFNKKVSHERIQKFLIENDNSTVACEVPVYMKTDNIPDAFLQVVDGVQYASGHIDIVRIVGSHIHIVDYKPNAHREKPFSQLFLYALCVCDMFGINIYNIVCSWFDENNYFEFYPYHYLKFLKEKNECEQAATRTSLPVGITSAL